MIDPAATDRGAADRDAHDEIVTSSPQGSIFAESWWLDLVVGPNRWHPYVLRGSSGVPTASWPVVERVSRIGLVAVGAPYSPSLGPLLTHPGDATRARHWSQEVEQLEELARLLARHAHVEAACSPELRYWTPLSWHGYTQTTRTTWRLAAPLDPGAVRAGMRKGARNALTSAVKAGLTCTGATVDELLDACEATFRRQDARLPNADVLRRLATGAVERSRGEVLAVRTAAGELVSAGLFVFDARWTWNLAQGRIDVAGAGGAPTLLMATAIEGAAARGTGFDFEGSMLEPVERFVRGFGGEPAAYSVIRRSGAGHARAVAWKRRAKRITRRS